MRTLVELIGCRGTGSWLLVGLVVTALLGACRSMVGTGVKGEAAQDPYAGVRFQVLENFEMEIKTTATNEARLLASQYANANPVLLPGVQRFGHKLGLLLAEPPARYAQYDFKTLVSYNPAYWQAERELAPLDVTLPYLTALLAILSEDYVTAARLLALNQATLPMTPKIRRVYCKPEAMLSTREFLMLEGVPYDIDRLTAAECERWSRVVARRMRGWPDQMALSRKLVELAVRRAILEAQGDEASRALKMPIRKRLKALESDWALAGNIDPIWSAALDASAEDWLAKRTLAQRWSRWIDYSDPAESAEISASVVTFEASGRPDLAWLTWRLGRVFELHVDDPRRWHAWAQELLGIRAAGELINAIMANPLAGRVGFPTPLDGFGEAWSGDPNIHPLLAIKIERQLSLVDTLLATVEKGTVTEANIHVRRLNYLSDIYAVDGAKCELEKIRSILGDKAPLLLPAQERIARLEGDYPRAMEIYRILLKDSKPEMEPARKNYATIMYMAGQYKGALEQYRKLIQSRTNDGYIRIMADLAARRIGERNLEGLESARARFPAHTWVGAGIRYMLGEIDSDQLVAAAQSGPKFEIIQHECEGYFWIGQRALAEGNREEGIKWLSRCLGTGFTSFIEYQVAKAELERLAPEKKPPRKEGEGRDSFGEQPA